MNNPLELLFGEGRPDIAALSPLAAARAQLAERRLDPLIRYYGMQPEMLAIRRELQAIERRLQMIESADEMRVVGSLDAISGAK